MPRATEIDKKIGRKILELRLALGLSREDVAENLEVTQQQIAKYESGKNRLSVSRLLEIAAALDAEPSYFYSDLTDTPNSGELDYRIRMNLELARNLKNIDNKDVQDTFLQLTKKIGDQLKKINSN